MPRTRVGLCFFDICISRYSDGLAHSVFNVDFFNRITQVGRCDAVSDTIDTVVLRGKFYHSWSVTQRWTLNVCENHVSTNHAAVPNAGE